MVARLHLVIVIVLRLEVIAVNWIIAAMITLLNRSRRCHYRVRRRSRHGAGLKQIVVSSWRRNHRAWPQQMMRGLILLIVLLFAALLMLIVAAMSQWLWLVMVVVVVMLLRLLGWVELMGRFNWPACEGRTQVACWMLMGLW
jgi:hypothetical protein